MSTIYDFEVKTIDGKTIALESFKGKVMLIVNVASKCGFTTQYEGLEKLYQTHRGEGLVILGFPCNQFKTQEPGTEQEIMEFCRLNYGVTFPLFAKVEVNGPAAHPLYIYLKTQCPGVLGSEAIKWNFTKFLVDASGTVLSRYAPSTEPADLEEDIIQLLPGSTP